MEPNKESSKEFTFSWKNIIWDWLVFIAAVVSITTVILEVYYDLNEQERMILLVVDLIALFIFMIDLTIIYNHFRGPFRSFVYRNWLDILSAIPIFRIIRIARFARITKLARLRRMAKLKRIEEVKEEVKVKES